MPISGDAKWSIPRRLSESLLLAALQLGQKYPTRLQLHTYAF